MLPLTWAKMKNLVANFTSKRPTLRALFSLLALMLTGFTSAWATSESQADNTGNECELTDQQQEMLALVNEARSKARQCGDQYFDAVGPLNWSCKLETAAKMHAEDMAENDYFSHTSPGGTDIQQRVSDSGYAWQAVGENIAAGHLSSSAAIEGWLESAGHCRNMMNDAFTEMGMADATPVESDTSYTSYWTQVFANPQ